MMTQFFGIVILEIDSSHAKQSSPIEYTLYFLFAGFVITLGIVYDAIFFVDFGSYIISSALPGLLPFGSEIIR